MIVLLLLLALLVPETVLGATGCTYPASLDTFPDEADLGDVTTTKFNKLQCAVEQLQSELGTDGPSDVALDLGDDGSNESAEINEIAVTNDSGGAFSEPDPDKLLIDLLKLTPTAFAVGDLPACSEGWSARLTDGAVSGRVVQCDDSSTWRCPEDNGSQSIIDPECPPYNANRGESSGGGSTVNGDAFTAVWERWKDLNEQGNRGKIQVLGRLATNAPLSFVSTSSDVDHGAFTSPFPSLIGSENGDSAILTGNSWNGSNVDLVHYAANEGNSQLNNFEISHMVFRGNPSNAHPSNCLLRVQNAFQGRVSYIILESTYNCGLNVLGGHNTFDHILIRQEGIAAGDMDADGRFLRIGGGNDIDVQDVQCEQSTDTIPLDMLHISKPASKVNVDKLVCTEDGVDAGIFFEDSIVEADCAACTINAVNLRTRGVAFYFDYNEVSTPKADDVPGWKLTNSWFEASSEATATHTHCIRTIDGAQNLVDKVDCSGYTTGIRADSDDNLVVRETRLMGTTAGFSAVDPTGYHIGPLTIEASTTGFSCTGNDGGGNRFGPIKWVGTPTTPFSIAACTAASTLFILDPGGVQTASCADSADGNPGETAAIAPYNGIINVTSADPDGCNAKYTDDGSKVANGFAHQICNAGYTGSGAGTLNILDEANIVDVSATINLAIGQCAAMRRNQTYGGVWTDL